MQEQNLCLLQGCTSTARAYQFVYLVYGLEFAIPIDDSSTIPLLRDVFLPINPRFSSIMAHDKKGIRRWKRVEVNLQDQVKVPSLPLESYDELFDEYLTKIGMDPLPGNRPLWEIHIAKYPTSNAAGHLIFKLHHALGDGYSLMGALLSCLNRADNPSLPLTFPSMRSISSKGRGMNVLSCVARTLSALFHGIYDLGWSFVKNNCVADDKTPIRSGSEGIGRHPVKVSTISLSLDDLKLIKSKLRVTINSVITGIICYGARLYMQEYDTRFCKSRSTALVLFNTRNVNGYKSVEEMLKTDSKMWGNHFAFLHVTLPGLTTSKSSNPLDFVLEAHRDIVRMKNSPAVYLTGLYLEIMRKFRGSEATSLYIKNSVKKSTLSITSLIGPVEEMSLANHPVKGLYFMIFGATVSLVITIMSYTRTLRIAVGVEKSFIDSHKFNSCLDKAFQLINKAATER